MRNRVVGVLAAGALGLAALTACSQAAGSPGTAIVVGDQSISTKQIDQIYAGFPSAITAQSTPATLKQEIVEQATFNTLAKQYAVDHHVKLSATSASDMAAIATQLGVPAGQASTNQAVKLIADSDSLLQDLINAHPAAAATDADVKEVYNELLDRGLPSTISYDAFKTQYAALLPTNLSQLNAVRAELTAQAGKTAIAVNPRYEANCPAAGQPCGGVDFPLTSFDPSGGQGGQPVPIVFIPMGRNPAPAVVDAPVPAPTS